MGCDPRVHHRRSIRVPDYDYSSPGLYFFTTVVRNRECILGEAVNGRVRLSLFGEKVEMAWSELPRHYGFIELGTFCIMPNHVHGIVIIKEMGAYAGIVAGEDVPDVGVGVPNVGAGVPNVGAAGIVAGAGVPDVGAEGIVVGVGVPNVGTAGIVVGEDVPDVGAGVADVGAGLRPAPTSDGKTIIAPRKGTFYKPYPLSEIIRAFKSFSAREINLLRGTPGIPVWQRNYYEHIIRNDDDLNRIHQYIESNPTNWEEDGEFQPYG